MVVWFGFEWADWLLKLHWYLCMKTTLENKSRNNSVHVDGGLYSGYHSLDMLLRFLYLGSMLNKIIRRVKGVLRKGKEYGY